jgi:hypothetical protein
VLLYVMKLTDMNFTQMSFIYEFKPGQQNMDQ